MSDNGFGRYLAEEHRGRGRSQEAADRRARIRAAASAGTLEYDLDGVALDPAGTEKGSRRPQRSTASEQPPSTRTLTPEGAHEGERDNPNGFGKHLSGDAPAGPSDAAQREADSPTSGRGFGRYL